MTSSCGLKKVIQVMIIIENYVLSAFTRQKAKTKQIYRIQLRSDSEEQSNMVVIKQHLERRRSTMVKKRRNTGCLKICK